MPETTVVQQDEQPVNQENATTATDKDNVVQAPVTPLQLSQEQMAAAMERIYEIMMPSYKKIYKKFYDEIEWVEHYYITDTQKGDKILEQFGNALMEEFKQNIDAIIDEAMSNFNEMLGVYPEDVRKQFKENFKLSFKDMMLQTMPSMMIMGLKKNAELKSSIYQEIIKEKKADKKNKTQ